MKKLIKILLVLALLLLVAAVAAPFVIPQEVYKDRVLAFISESSGRKVDVKGNMGLSILPNPAIVVEDITIANPAGFSKDPMAHIGKLRLELAMAALLKGKLEVTSIDLVKPDVKLEKNKGGAANWDFAAPVKTQDEQEKQATEAKAEGQEPLPVVIESVSISEGSLTYREGDQKPLSLSDLSFKTNVPTQDFALNMKGSAKWNGEAVDFKIVTDSDKQLSLQLKSSRIALEHQGKLAGEDMATISSRGNISLSIPSVNSLMEWVGKPRTSLADGKDAVELKGDAVIGAGSIGFKGTFKLAGVNGDGDLHMDTASAIPFILAKLDIKDTIDLENFMPAEKKSAAAKAGEAPSAASDEKIDLSGLRAVNADIEAKIPAIVKGKLKLEAIPLKAVLKQGVLQLSIPSMKLFEGTGNAAIMADGSGSEARFRAEIGLEKVSAEQMLSAMADYERLSGKMDLSTIVAAQGISKEQLKRSLAGNGKFEIKDGAYKGINVASFIRKARSGFIGVDDSSQQTDFAALTGSFNIAQGVLNNQDMMLKAPILRLTGKGIIDLVQERIDYRLITKLAETTKGQGGKEFEDVAGIEIPVIVEGPLSSPSFKPDLKGIIEEGIKNPEKIENTMKVIKENTKDLNSVDDIKKQLKGGGLKNLLGK